MASRNSGPTTLSLPQAVLGYSSEQVIEHDLLWKALVSVAMFCQIVPCSDSESGRE
jgi:hypothetical protein